MGKKDTFKARSSGLKHKAEEKTRNPFEVHINRSKHDVVGRKRKEDKGVPGISRAKALRKREKTLLQEYKSRHKSNVFVDRRIGENDPTMDPEKKMALRMAAVRIRQSNK
ncbi:nucleolar complex protein 14, partial [Halocaridina rubra]